MQLLTESSPIFYRLKQIMFRDPVEFILEGLSVYTINYSTLVWINIIVTKSTKNLRNDKNIFIRFWFSYKKIMYDNFKINNYGWLKKDVFVSVHLLLNLH